MSVLNSSKRLKKELTLFNIYTIATGATIASGFFLLPGLAFTQAGPAMLLSYLIAAIPVIPALFNIAELSTAMPRAGGVYFFLDRSMGPLMGTIGGLGTWLALVLKTSFALVGIGAYTSLFFPQVPLVPLAIFFAILFGLINLMGAKKAGIFQGILVVALLILLTFFSATGIFQVDLRNMKGFFDKGFDSIFATAGLVYVSYVGLTKIASVSEEVKNPDKNIPRAMFLALGTAVLIYLIGVSVIISTVPGESLQNDLTPVATAAETIMGHTGAIIMTIAAIFAFFSVANAGILSCSRYPLAMSRDHLMPRFLRILTKKRTPVYAISVTVLFVILILLFFDASKIAKLAGSFQLLLFSLISLAVIVMRESRLESYDPGYRSPFYPWMQILGIILPLWLISEMGLMPSLFSLSLIIIGALYYFYYGRKRVVRDGAIYHIFARLGKRRFDGLDTELRSILKEKGLREQDPFDMVVAEAQFKDFTKKITFEEIVAEVSAMLAQKLNCKAEVLKKSFLEGTRIGATPVSHGAALPHVRIKDIDDSILVMVRSRIGVYVDVDKTLISEADIDKPIHAFFFLVSSDDNPGQHLRILAQIASHVDDEKFLVRWLIAKNEQELKELLLRDDRFISLQLRSKAKAASLIDVKIRDVHLPQGCLIALIHREGEIVVPGGNTILKENDRLTIIGYPAGIKEIYDNYFGT
jgi:amino acid transporter/mannitol/fructose-specific phosphotransferase system IIA component (Ntr-type)